MPGKNYPGFFVRDILAIFEKNITMRSILSLFIFSMLLNFISTAQVNVYHVNSSTGEPSGIGVFYTLPRTVLKVDVWIKTQENIKGPFADYADKYFGFDNMVNYDYTSYNIEDVSITALHEPDPLQVYYAESGEPISKEQKTLFLELDRAGMLLSANNYDEVKPETHVSDGQIVVYQSDDDATDRVFDFIRSSKIRSISDTIIRRVTIDTTVVEKQFLRTRITDKSNEDMAREVLGKIEEIRDAKLKLLTGYQEIAYAEGTIKFMHSELHKLENEYLDLFRGKRFSGVEHYTYFVTPQKETGPQSIPVFKFSESTGVSPWRGSSGENVTLEINSNGYSRVVENYSLPPKGETDQTGLYYRIPGMADIVLTLDDKELFNGKFIVNQLGTIKNLDAHNFRVRFDPETGGILNSILK